ncbi:hypothetical protein GCM10010413_15920 [Promicromonospora sukumoe]
MLAYVWGYVWGRGGPGQGRRGRRAIKVAGATHTPAEGPEPLGESAVGAAQYWLFFSQSASKTPPSATFT